MIPARLAAIMGCSDIAALSEANLKRFIDHDEHTDLEFKSEYWGQTAGDKRELARDVAALANAAGGLIVVGIRDSDGVAVKMTPFPASFEVPVAIEQVAAGLIHPPPDVQACWVRSDSRPGAGYAVVAVTPNGWAPHLVLQGERSVCYPLKLTKSKTYLSEQMIAERYRRRLEDQVSRRDIADEMSRSIDRHRLVDSSDAAGWMSICLIPSAPGYVPITNELVKDDTLGERGPNYCPLPQSTLAYFSTHTTKRIGHRRYVLLADEVDAPSNTARRWAAHLYADGSAAVTFRVAERAANIELHFPHRNVDPADLLVPDESLVASTWDALSLCTAHATRAGVAGRADLHLDFNPSTGNVFACHTRGHPLPHRRVWSPVAAESPLPRQSSVIDVATAHASQSEFFSTLWSLLSGFFQAVGVPETPQLTSAGELRTNYWSNEAQGLLARWSEGRDDVELVNQQLP